MAHRERFDEDQNDHDTLRSDPVFKLIADRLPDDPQDLASQPTLSRFENAVAIPDLWRLRDVLQLTYTFGIGMNLTLKKLSDELLATAIGQYEQTGEKQRLFTGTWYQAGSWEQPRYVIIKAEAHAQGTNRRAVVSNRPGAPILPQATYDEYTQRGESENRNKELKLGMRADRLSDHRFLANFFRLYLHASALNLLTRLRRSVSHNPSPAELGIPSPLPPEALTGRQRKQRFNRRRDADPLGEGHPCTWRTRLIKVAAEVTLSARRIVVTLSNSWPHLNHFADILQHILPHPPPLR